MHGKRSYRILVVEDLGPLAMLVKWIVEEAGSEVIGPYATVQEAGEAVERERPEIALVDIGLADGSGLDLLPALVDAGVYAVLVTGHSRPPVHAFPQVPWLEKPLTAEKLDSIIDQYAAGSAG